MNSSLPDMRATNMALDCAPFNCSEIRSTPGANIASPIISSLTGIIGNVIALFVLHYSSRKEQTRTVFYVLVGGLAWTDLMGIILTTWPVLIVYCMGEWPGGTGLCNYHAFAMICFSLITPFIVCTMALERYVGLRHGYFYQSHFNRTRARVVLLIQWVYVLLFAALPLFGFGQYAVQYPRTWCYLNIHPQTALDSAYATTFAIINLLLIFIIVVCNIIVIVTLINMRKKRQYQHSPASQRYRYKNQKQHEVELQMMVLLVGITCVFTVCWAPLMVQILINQLWDHGGDHRQDLLAVRLASINQILDPWVYILFRKVFFTRCWGCIKRAFQAPARLMSLQDTKLQGVTSFPRVSLQQPRITCQPPTPKPAFRCSPELKRDEEEVTPTRNDSGSDSGNEDNSSAAEVFLSPEQQEATIKSRSWCCPYEPSGFHPPRKYRSQSTQTPDDTRAEVKAALLPKNSIQDGVFLNPGDLQKATQSPH